MRECRLHHAGLHGWSWSARKRSGWLLEGLLCDKRRLPRGRRHGTSVIDRLRTRRRQRDTAPSLRGWRCRRLGTLASPYGLGGQRLFLVPLPFEHEVEHRIRIALVIALAIGALPTESWPLGITGDLSVALFRLAESDPRPLTLGGISQEQAARLEPPLVVAKLADIENVAGAQRQAVEHRAVAGVRMLAADANVDLAHAIPLALINVVDEI